jgi:hypothetical protein
MFTINPHGEHIGSEQLEAYACARRSERGTKTMKQVAALLSMIGSATLLALVVGCATTIRTEDLLSAAGFKIVPATTPELQARLKAIPADKLTMVQRDGKEYFVFPDVTQNVLYVGQNGQYQRYQQLRLQNQLAQEQLNAAELNADWGAWGTWGGEGWWSPLSP